MSRPSPFAVTLTASQRRVLEGRLRRPTAQQREVIRANFLFIPYYPFWALTVITLDIFVIWAVSAHGRELRDPV